MPRGTEEGQEIRLEQPEFQLFANKPVHFACIALSAAPKIAAAMSFELAATTCWIRQRPRLHAPLRAVIRFGKGGERLIPVKFGANLNEVGTLETWAESKISEHRWRLAISAPQDRPPSTAHPQSRRPSSARQAQQGAAEELIEQVFGKPGAVPLPPEQLPARLEQALGFGTYFLAARHHSRLCR